MRKSVLFIIAIIVFAGFTSRALAHDGAWDVNIPGWDAVQLGHTDQDPWKGWATLTVTNTMLDDWGDFHFQIYEPMSYSVIFSPAGGPFVMLDGSNNPYPGYSYSISGDQKAVDFLFYGSPVINSETVTFKVYTDNTANQHAWFGLMVYPTPVPEPATIGLLALGALALLRKRK